MLKPITDIINAHTLAAVAYHMSIQQARSSEDGAGCLYVTADGDRCPVGWLMTEEHIAFLKFTDDPASECDSYMTVTVDNLPLRMRYELAEEVALPDINSGYAISALRRLQEWHDDNEALCSFGSLLWFGNASYDAILQSIRSLRVFCYPQY